MHEICLYIFYSSKVISNYKKCLNALLLIGLSYNLLYFV